MFLFDTTITVVNSIYNQSTGFDDYFNTVIQNCSWYSQLKAASGTDGLQYSKVYKVRVAEGISNISKQLVLQENYRNPETECTLCAGTIIVKGVITQAPQNGEEYSALLTNHSEAFQVLAVHNNSRIGAKHFYIEGK